MFVLVNYSDAYGLSHTGTFATHKEAYEYISYDVDKDFDLDLMNLYPFDNQQDNMIYNGINGEVWAGYDWCNWYDEYGYGEKWLIIKV